MINLKKIDVVDLKPIKELQWHKYSKFYEILENGKLINYAINWGFQRPDYYGMVNRHDNWFVVPVNEITNAINTKSKTDLKKNWDFEQASGKSAKFFQAQYLKVNYGLKEALENVATVTPEDEHNSVIMPYSEIEGAKVFIVNKNEWQKLRNNQKRSLNMEDLVKLPNQEVGILITADGGPYVASSKRSLMLDSKSDEYVVLTPSKITIAGEELYCIILMPRKEKLFKNVTVEAT